MAIMNKILRIKNWDEDYDGWTFTFSIQARKGDGHLKARVQVREKMFFNLFTTGSVKYKEKGDEWCSGRKDLEEQVATLREAAKAFVDSIEEAKNISGSLPTPST